MSSALIKAREQALHNNNTQQQQQNVIFPPPTLWHSQGKDKCPRLYFYGLHVPLFSSAQSLKIHPPLSAMCIMNDFFPVGTWEEEDSELQEQEQRSYLDYYGADLSHTPKWRIIEMLRTVQQLYEQLSNEANGGATRASSVIASNNNQQQVNFVLPSGVSVDLSTAEGIAALIEELSGTCLVETLSTIPSAGTYLNCLGSEDGILRIANFVQEEDYRPAIALGQTAEATLKITKGEEEQREQRAERF